MTQHCEPVIARVRVNEQGRLVIPLAVRRAAGISPGEEVALIVEGDHVEIVTDSALLARIHENALRSTAIGSVVDELIAERRAEAARELAESAG